MTKQYQARLEMINTLSLTLKAKFVGLDETIDKILEQITPWFVYQVPRQYPLIINVWGITGTGKTELVTDICNGLQIITTFFDSQEFLPSISGLRKSDFKDLRDCNPQAIIIDEFHRLKTKTQNDDPKENDGRYRLWEILSGSIKINYAFDETVSSSMRKYHSHKGYDGADHTEEKAIRRAHADLFDSIFYYKGYPLEPMGAEFAKILERNVDKTFKDYFVEIVEFVSKLTKIENISTKNNLIFIMGNLDKAYRSVVDDIESLDADELSDRLGKITSQECKEALLTIFAPEQVARLGSNHFVMPSIKKASYQSVIDKNIATINKMYEEKFGLTLVLDNSVREMIYKQLVIPAQGMRNVLTGFNGLVDSPLSQMITNLIPFKDEPVFISFKDASLIFEVCDKVFTKLVDLPRRTNLTTPEFLHRISIHEAGHALVYYLTRGESPTKVVVETSTSGAAGYVKKKEREFTTKKHMKDDVMVAFGGYFAEKLTFGADNICSGSYGDLRNAGNKLTQMVNSLGFGSKLTPHVLGSSFEASILRTLEKDKDKEIQDLFESISKETEALILKNQDSLNALAEWLKVKKQVTEQEMNTFMTSIKTEETKVESSEWIPTTPVVEQELRHMDKK